VTAVKGSFRHGSSLSFNRTGEFMVYFSSSRTGILYTVNSETGVTKTIGFPMNPPKKELKRQNNKGKGKVHIRISHKRPEEGGGRSTS
jgi:hypothetical protein